MRRGEMLALRFGDIDWTRHRIMLGGETTKSGKGAVPLATARLRAVLEWLRLQAEGEKKPDAALVFSDETALPVGAFRPSGYGCAASAHRESGVENVWLDCTDTRLSRAVPAHQSAPARLRHEYAWRLIERGVPLSPVRDLLGHASIVTTERYDNQQMERLQVARASWNWASSSGTDAGIRDRVSHFFHNPSAGRDSGTGHYNRGRP